MHSPLLDLLERAIERHSGTTPALDIVRPLVNSPIVALIVSATPNPVDDLILSFARKLLPPTPAPAAASTSG